VKCAYLKTNSEKNRHTHPFPFIISYFTLINGAFFISWTSRSAKKLEGKRNQKLKILLLSEMEQDLPANKESVSSFI
jgi:hypothetical protein